MDIRRSLSAEDHGVPLCSKDLVSRPPRSKMDRARRAIWDSGVACAVLGVFIYSLSNLCVKLTGGRVPFMEVSVIRSAYNILLTAMMSYVSGEGPLWGQRENYLLLFLRGLSGGSGVTLVFLSILCLPLPDSTVIQNLKAPFTAVLAYMCLHEPMGLRGWSGVALSFSGVAVLAQPTWLGFSAGAVGQLSLSSPRQVLGITAGIAGAFILGAANIVVRFIGNREPALVSTLWLNAVTLGLFVVPMAAGWPNAPRLPSLADNALLFGVAVCSLFGNVLITRALQLMSAGPMAAIGFTGTLYGFLFGALIFHNPITLPGLAGAGAVLAGVLLVTLRAKKRHAQLPVAALDAAAAHQDGVLLMPLGKQQPWADAGSGEDEHDRAPLVVVGHCSSSDGGPAIATQAVATEDKQQQQQQQQQQQRQQVPHDEAATSLVRASRRPVLHANTGGSGSSSNDGGGSGGGSGDASSPRRSSLTASSLLHTASAVWDSTAATCTHGDDDAPASDALECLVLSALDNPGLSPTHCDRDAVLPTFVRPEGPARAGSASGLPLGQHVRHASSQLSRFSSGTISAGAAEAPAQAPQFRLQPGHFQQPEVLQIPRVLEPAAESPSIREPASRSASGVEMAASPAALLQATLPAGAEVTGRSSCEVDGESAAAATGWPQRPAGAAPGNASGVGSAADAASTDAGPPPLIWVGSAVRVAAANSGPGPLAAAAGGDSLQEASSGTGGAGEADVGLAIAAPRSDDLELPSEEGPLLGGVARRG